jgi:hypothetical protein
VTRRPPPPPPPPAGSKAAAKAATKAEAMAAEAAAAALKRIDLQLTVAAPAWRLAEKLCGFSGRALLSTHTLAQVALHRGADLVYGVAANMILTSSSYQGNKGNGHSGGNVSSSSSSKGQQSHGQQQNHHQNQNQNQPQHGDDPANADDEAGLTGGARLEHMTLLPPGGDWLALALRCGGLKTAAASVPHAPNKLSWEQKVWRTHARTHTHTRTRTHLGLTPSTQGHPVLMNEALIHVSLSLSHSLSSNDVMCNTFTLSNVCSNKVM